MMAQSFEMFLSFHWNQLWLLESVSLTIILYCQLQCIIHCKDTSNMTQSGGRSHISLVERRPCEVQVNMIRDTLVVFSCVLSILLLVISVSGFFILLISNDCNIFYPYSQVPFNPPQPANFVPPQGHLSPSHNAAFFYNSTLCQLTLILGEVLIALVIIFNNEVYYKGRGRDSSNRLDYHPLPGTSSTVKGANLANSHGKCSYIFLLKLIFIFLISISFFLRLVTSAWNITPSYSPGNQISMSILSSAFPQSSSYVAKMIDALITGALNFSVVLYICSFIELLLFLFVLGVWEFWPPANTKLPNTHRIAFFKLWHIFCVYPHNAWNLPFKYHISSIFFEGTLHFNLYNVCQLNVLNVNFAFIHLS